ncbi:hypothetical protein [Crossiella sp. NPDC003009]
MRWPLVSSALAAALLLGSAPLPAAAAPDPVCVTSCDGLDPGRACHSP